MLTAKGAVPELPVAEVPKLPLAGAPLPCAVEFKAKMKDGGSATQTCQFSGGFTVQRCGFSKGFENVVTVEVNVVSALGVAALAPAAVLRIDDFKHTNKA